MLHVAPAHPIGAYVSVWPCPVGLGDVGDVSPTPFHLSYYTMYIPRAIL